MVKISKAKPNTICAIDASTHSLAFAVFHENHLIKYGKITFTGATIYEKVADAAKKSLAFFKMFNVDAVVIEHTIFLNSPKTAADLALIQGALLGAASVCGIKLAGSINPITWQNSIGNPKLSNEEKKKLMEDFPGKTKNWYQNKSREIRKQRTIKFVNTYYDKDLDDDDVADAIGIGHYCINNWERLTK